MKRVGRALPLTVATAFLMEQLDSSVVTTALPAMARDFAVPIASLAVAVTGYLVSLAVFMPLGGWLSDRFGGRQVFMTALGVFALGSLICGLAPNAAALVVGRIVQGMGGAMMTPVGRTMLMSSVPKSDYVRAMNYVIIPALMGPAIGPLVGGFFSTYLSWRWIFLINLPLAAVGLVMARRHMPAGLADEDQCVAPPDWIGYAFLVICLGCGQAAMEGLGREAPSAGTLAMALASGLGGTLFYRRFRRIGSGILDLSLVRIRTFRLSMTAGSVARAGLGGVPLLLPLLLQLVFHYDPFKSGLVTFLVAIGAAVIKPVMSVALRRLGCRTLLLLNSLATAAGLIGFLAFRDARSLWLMPAYVFAFGLLRSVQMSTMNSLSYADIDKRDMARASTLSTLAQRLSMGLGVNVAATTLAFASQADQPDLRAFGYAFGVAAVFVLIAGAMFMKLRATDGWQVSNRAAPPATEGPSEL